MPNNTITIPCAGKPPKITLLESRTGIFLPLIAGAIISGFLPLLFAGDNEAADIPNLIPIFALVVGISLWWSSEQERSSRADRWVAIILSILFLIPSYQIGWLIVLTMTLWLSRYTDKNPKLRNALLIIALATLQPLLVTYLLKWFASPILTFDASLVSSLLKLITGEGSHIGNIVYGPAEHQLLILRGCSSITNLGTAWLVWFAVSRFRGIALNLREFIVVAMLTLTMVGLNLLRLYTMAIDLNWHHWWHSEAGEQIYQLVSASVLLISIVLGIRYVGLYRKTTG